MLAQENHFKSYDKVRLRKDGKKMYHTNPVQKKTGSLILISGKVFFGGEENYHK